MMKDHLSDIIHTTGVAFVVICATIYAFGVKDHSSNIWIVYGSAIAFFAGRAGVDRLRSPSRVGDRV